MQALIVLHELVCGLLPGSAVEALLRLHELLGLG